MKAQLAWRRITTEQHDKIVAALKGKGSKVHLTYPAADPAAALFAIDIAKTLTDAGVETSGNANVVAGVVELGLAISRLPGNQVPGPDWIALADAFKQAGWTFGLGEPADRLTISVGSKKSPF